MTGPEGPVALATGDDRGDPSRGLGGRVAALTAVRFTSVAAGFAASVLGARLIGADGMGAAGVSLTVATVAALIATAGIGQAAIYHLGIAPADRPRTVGRIVTLGTGATLLAATVSAVVVVTFGQALGVRTDASLATVALAAALVAFELGGSLLLGLHAARAYVTIQLVEALVSLGLTLAILAVVARTADGFIGAAAMGSAFAGGVALVVVVRAIRPRGFAFDPGFTRAVLSFGLRGQLGNVLQFLNLRIDLLLVPAFLDLRLAGLYFIAGRVSESLAVVASAAGAFIFPAVASQRDRLATITTARLTRATLLVVGAGVVVTLAAADLVVGIAFGPEFAEATGALRILAAGMLPVAVSRVLSGDLKGRGRPGLVSIASGVALVTNVVGDVLLIPNWGIAGAAFASLFANLAGAAVLAWAYVRVARGSAAALLPRPGDAVSLALAIWSRLPGLPRRSPVSGPPGADR